MRNKSRRSGSILVIVTVISLVIFTALFSLSYITTTNIFTTGNLLSELHATYLAESIVTQIDAQVNSRPWRERPWFTAAQGAGGTDGIVPMAVFDKSTPFLDLSRDSLTADKYDFNGIVKDLPGTLREYRVYLEVTVEGEPYAFSWDKRYEIELLSGFNREPARLDKVLDFLDSESTPVDTLVDQVKETAIDAPPPDTNDTSQRDRRRRLRDAEPNFRATTIAPNIESTPVEPRDPSSSGDNAEENAWGGESEGDWGGGLDREGPPDGWDDEEEG